MRKIHFVGSLPPSVTEEGPLLVMEWALHTSGWFQGHADLTGVPCDLDPRWIIDYLDGLADRAAFRPLRKGNSSDYDHMPLYRIARGHTIGTFDVATRRTGELRDVVDAYLELRKTHERAPMRSSLGPMPPLRISLPSPLDLALFVFCGKVDLLRHPLRSLRGTWLAMRYLKLFGRAMAAEVTDVNAYAARNDAAIVWQLEAPSVLYVMNLVPRFLQAGVAHLLAELHASVLARLWDFDMELHLCHGDLGHKAITHGTAEQMVTFLNRLGPLLDQHSVDRPPVHLPFACGDEPAPTNVEFYAPLAQLDEDWVIYAGVVDEHDPKASRIALHHVETQSGRVAAAVAPACGLGRRTLADAEDAVEGCVAIVDVDRPEGVKATEEAK
jgi:hypothetical protein